MRNRNYTTFDQSEHLAELGVPRTTADMAFCGEVNDYGTYSYTLLKVKDWTLPEVHSFASEPLPDVPVWTSGALLRILPTVVNNFLLHIFKRTVKDADGNSTDTYVIGYYKESPTDGLFCSEEKNMTDVAYDVLCYLLENKIVSFQ